MNKAATLARVLEVEPGDVMCLLLMETSLDVLQAIEECKRPPSLSHG